MLLHRSAHPVDLGVATYGLMVRVNEDDFVVLVGRVLANPVGVQDTQTLQPPGKNKPDYLSEHKSKIL